MGAFRENGRVEGLLRVEKEGVNTCKPLRRSTGCPGRVAILGQCFYMSWVILHDEVQHHEALDGGDSCLIVHCSVRSLAIRAGKVFDRRKKVD